jgi:hypothetical protein
LGVFMGNAFTAAQFNDDLLLVKIE